MSGLLNPLSQRGPLPNLSRPVDLILNRPRAPRYQAPFHLGKRTAGFERFFDYWLDLVEDVDISSRKDPNAHVRMMRDPQIYACFTIRALATASLPWSLRPATDTSEAKDYASRAERMLRAMPNFSQVIKNLLLAIPMGLSINEVVWDVDQNNTFKPYRILPSHKDRYVFDLDGNLALRSPIDVFWGERVPDYTFIPHIFDQVPGSFHAPAEEARLLFGFGLNDILYPTWFAKQIVLRMDLRYLERFAQAIRVGRYPKKNEQGQGAIQRLMDQIMHDGVALFPSDEGYDFNLLEASQGGHTSFQTMLEYLDKQISKAYLGSTLLLDVGDVGTYSLGRVHERTTFGRIAEYDHHAVSGTLNTYLLPWIFLMNSWPMEMLPRHEFTLKESHNIAELIEALRIAQSMGYEISAEMVEEATGIRRARSDETILRIDPMDASGKGSVQQIGGTENILAPGWGQNELDAMPRNLREMRQRVEALEMALLMRQAESARAKFVA